MKPLTCSWIRTFVLLAVIVIFLSASLSALNTSTHQLVNRRAALTSISFDAYLRGSLGFSGGLTTGLRHGSTRVSIQDWIEEGGEREDDLLRFLRHFHDPFEPWETAGWNIGLDRHDSSVRWMQEPNQGGASTGGFWSWRDARRLYYQALTEADPVRREALWADVFRALGQIMHLVADASVPEHTRNDAHLLGALKLGDSYERWVGNQHGGGNAAREAQFIADYLSAPIGFDARILQLAPPNGEGIARVPVARLIDSDVYNGTNPGVTLGSFVGLAEIANANFFSENTLRARYPFPSDDGLIPVNLATPFGRVRRYFSRPEGQGLLPANPLRAECAAEAYWIRGELVQPPPYPCTDSVVWNQVAAHMLPRAVGYARGVLEYFFRGKLRVRQVIARSSGIFIDIENASDEPMEGVFEVYARHQKGSPTEQRRRMSVLNEGNPISLDPGDWDRFPLQVSSGAATPYHVLVFRGRLGLEEDAVVGQVFAVPDVQIVQQSSVADVTKTCSVQVFPSPSFYDPVREILSCIWRPIHRVEGRLVTNFAGADVTDPTSPAINRVEAFWTGSVRGPAPLTINGVRYASGVWTRQGNEPGPDEFLIMDPAERRDSRLTLTVVLRSGERMSTQLATFKSHVASSEKGAGPLFLANGSVEWLLTSFRRWQVEPNVNRTLFSIDSIGGYPVPTLRFSEKLSEIPEIWREVLKVTSLGVGSQFVLDVFERGFTLKSEAVARLSGIALEEPRFPGPPDLHWSAVVTSRPRSPVVVQYWQAFVANGDPSPVTFTVTAHEAVAP